MEQNPPQNLFNPNVTEPFGTARHDAEEFRTIPHSSERKESHTLTTREVARMFELAGVSRTERSIVKWCQPHGAMPSRLDAFYDPNERRYFITPESVERAIKEEQAKATRPQPDTEPFRTVPNASEPVGNRPAGKKESHHIEDKDFELELMDLKITNRAKDQFIKQLQSERADMLDKLVANSRVLGQLETKLIQLEAPVPRNHYADMEANALSKESRSRNNLS